MNKNYSIVNNLSKHRITLAEERVLNKGLSFCITNEKINEKILHEDIKRFERKLQLFYYFEKNRRDEEGIEYLIQGYRGKYQIMYTKYMYISNRICIATVFE